MMMVMALSMLVIGYMYLTGFNEHFGGDSIESVGVVHNVHVVEQEDTSQGAVDL